MAPDETKPLSAFGFLTVRDDPDHGQFGGYLILCPLGRPLEFHCSTPVLPSRAQQILYGPTLGPYLLGEVLGQTLVEKAQLSMLAILTDNLDMQSIALSGSEPVLYVSRPQNPSPPSEPDTAQQAPEVHLGGYQLSGTEVCTWNPQRIGELLGDLASRVDLLEPFERIRLAIGEAQRISGAGPDLMDDDDEQPAAA